MKKKTKKKVLIKIPLNNFQRRFDILLKNKIDFELKQNSSSGTIKTSYLKTIYSNNSVLMKEMYFLKKVIDNITPDKVNLEQDFNCDFFGKRIFTNSFELNNCIEIDLNAAYFTTAKKLNFIDDEIYKLGLEVSKGTRLISIGNLIKCNKFYEAANGNLKFIKEVKQEPHHRAAWKQIVTHCDTSIKNVANQLNTFLFYWVDAVFLFNDSESEKCISLFKEIGFDTKIIKHEKIIYNREEQLFTTVNGEKRKPYYFPKKSKYIDSMLNKI